MMSDEIVIIYKEIGKKPVIRKIQNKLEVLQNLLSGEPDYIKFEDITIMARKDRKKLQPNIYLNTNILNVRERNVRGNIVIIGRKDEKFKSLTNEQIMKYKKFLQEESFSNNKN